MASLKSVIGPNAVNADSRVSVDVPEIARSQNKVSDSTVNAPNEAIATPLCVKT